MVIDDRDRSFFLEEFRRITVAVAVEDATPAGLAVLERVVDELVGNQTRVVVVVGGEPTAVEVADRLRAEVAGPHPADGTGDRAAQFLSRLWLLLCDRGVVVVPSVGASCATDAAGLAVQVRLPKLVLTGGAERWDVALRSFITLDQLDAELGVLDDLPGGRATRTAMRDAIEGGVPSVNLCRLDQLDVELFTFDGAGTLCTEHDFLEARPFGLDELPTVEDFVAKGVSQGYLRPRTREEVARLLVTGLGVHVVGSGHLVGIGALETAAYRADGVGEIASLFAAGRFTGGGVGWRLVTALVERAEQQGLRAVFACTVSPDAETLFERNGFHRVDPGEVPAAKWDGYDEDRRRRVRCVWRDLGEG
ncbi:MAG: GNAT family N-acetyltransferase [Acidimicrobiales bacterium]